MKTKMVFHFILISTFLLVFHIPAGATPIENGDFETGDFTGWTVIWSFPPSPLPPGLPPGSVVAEPSGNNYALLRESGADNFEGVGLVQEVILDPCAAFLEFDYSASQGAYMGDPARDNFEVWLGGTLLFSTPFVEDGDPNITTEPSFSHVAVALNEFDLSSYWGEPTELTFFIDDGDIEYLSFLALDNISVQPIPEPATLILLGIGLVGVGAYRRTWKSKPG